MIVRLLTEEHKDLLTGQAWDSETYFNPTIDANGNWFISQEEVNGCIYQSQYPFLASLELIPYNPIISEFPI